MHIPAFAVGSQHTIATNNNEKGDNDAVCNSGYRAFLCTIDIIRSQTRALIVAVNGLKYERAWLVKKELLHSLDLAAFVIGGVPPSNRDSLVVQFNCIMRIAINAINAAPTLSVDAVSQIRDTLGATIEHLSPPERQVRWDDWYAEEERWTTERVLAGPLPMVDRR